MLTAAPAALTLSLTLQSPMTKWLTYVMRLMIITMIFMMWIWALSMTGSFQLEPNVRPSTKKRAGAKAVKAFEGNTGCGTLSETDATTYRAISARGNFLAQDRGDISFSSQELCRDFSKPNDNSVAKLKRLGRYHLGHLRLVYCYDYAETPATHIEVYCDTDFAGCSITRRSTSGGCAMVGSAMIKHWAKTGINLQ